MDVVDDNGNVIPKSSQESKRVLAGVLGILLGVFGIHKFVLGYTNEGIILLIISLVTCGIAGSIIGLIEGIVYLTKSDEEFVYMYQINKKAWF
jgi:TM2 domain-containing membrane protein YozV